jgi:hypothetical protein
MLRKQRTTELFVFITVGRIISMQTHYRVKLRRNEHTGTVILLNRRSGTIDVAT